MIFLLPLTFRDSITFYFPFNEKVVRLQPLIFNYFINIVLVSQLLVPGVIC